MLYLLADHLRGSLADLETCFKEDGRLDLKKAKLLGVAHLIKKLEVEAVGRMDGKTLYKTKIELYGSQSAAKILSKIQGLEQAPRRNEEDVARINREIALLVSEGWEPEEARKIVIEAEPSAAAWLM